MLQIAASSVGNFFVNSGQEKDGFGVRNVQDGVMRTVQKEKPHADFSGIFVLKISFNILNTDCYVVHLI